MPQENKPVSTMEWPKDHKNPNCPTWDVEEKRDQAVSPPCEPGSNSSQERAPSGGFMDCLYTRE